MGAFLMCLTAFLAGGLTLFSGFGLGTLLMPVVALFLPVETAIAVTAVVHLLNNLAKLALVGRFAKRTFIFRFGFPAMFASMGGALVLQRLSDLAPLAQYEWLGRQFEILPLKAAIAALLIAFLYIEARIPEHEWRFDDRYLPLGGLLSGFFGGLSGHQGAFRSLYLVNAGLTKEQFLGTSVVIACLVDLAR
ncbi:MAG: TSUP family transporter, partial [Nitrospiraceae bacterium]